jgi:hypothetical protein
LLPLAVKLLSPQEVIRRQRVTTILQAVMCVEEVALDPDQAVQPLSLNKKRDARGAVRITRSEPRH